MERVFSSIFSRTPTTKTGSCLAVFLISLLKSASLVKSFIYTIFNTATRQQHAPENIHEKAREEVRARASISPVILTFIPIFTRAMRKMSSRQSADCEDPNPLNTLTDRLNTLLNSSGPGYTLSLCPSQQYYIEAPLLFSFADQEISTLGYPTPDASGVDERAILIVNGPVSNGTGHTTAVDGTCQLCSGVKLRNIQVCSVAYSVAYLAETCFDRSMAHVPVRPRQVVVQTLSSAVRMRRGSSSNMCTHGIRAHGLACTSRRVAWTATM